MKIGSQLFSSEIRLYIDYDNDLYFEKMNQVFSKRVRRKIPECGYKH